MGNRRVGGCGSSPRSVSAAIALRTAGHGRFACGRAAAGRKARRRWGAVAEPWVGVDSSKPPRLLATVASPLVSGPSRRRLAGAGRRKPQPPCVGNASVRRSGLFEKVHTENSEITDCTLYSFF